MKKFKMHQLISVIFFLVVQLFVFVYRQDLINTWVIDKKEPLPFMVTHNMHVILMIINAF